MRKRGVRLSEDRYLNICFVDLPINELEPWFGAHLRQSEMTRDGKGFDDYLKRKEAEDPHQIPKPDSIETPVLERKRRSPEFRLLCLDELSDKTIIEIDNFYSAYRESFGGELISSFIECNFYEFVYYEVDGVFQYSAMNIWSDLRRYQRVVEIFYLPDEAEQKRKFLFNQLGEPLRWEKTEKYLNRDMKERLSYETLTDYLYSLGIDYKRYINREFFRAIQYSGDILGEDMSAYDDLAIMYRDKLQKILF